MTQTTDIRPLLDGAPLRPFHIRVLVICLLLALVNGLDNQMLANTIPGMAEDWGVAPESFSIALTAGLIGMMIGATLFGNLADRIGLRPVLILVTLIYGVMTLITPLADNTTTLTAIRLVAGFGLGGLPSAITAMLTEYSPKNWRSSFGNWVLTGIPLGGFIGSILASALMPSTGWQFIYLLSGGISLAFAALAFLRLPEAPSALIRIRKDQTKLHGHLKKITSTPPPEDTTLSVGGEDESKSSVRQVF